MKKKLIVLGALILICSMLNKGWADTSYLESQVNNLPDQEEMLQSYSIGTLIRAIKNIHAQDENFKCVADKFVSNSVRFVTSYDKDGSPCAIYDRAFPTLLLNRDKASHITSIPLKGYTSDDYSKWLDGDYDHILNTNREYVKNFNMETYNNSWVTALPFKNNVRKNRNGIIESFYLSDLDLGKFDFTQADKNELNILFKNARDIGDFSRFQEITNNPNRLLEKIKFKWNDVKKLYDVILEFNFLPIKPPVELVNYKAQYTFAAERMIRSGIKKALLYLAGKIPEPMTNRIITLAIDETFYFIEMTYSYHMNQLESTLRLNLEGKIKTEIPRDEIDKGLNILFANQGSLITQYITSMITGQTVDLDKLDKMGKATRYSVEKQRVNTMRQLYSDLFHKKGCLMKKVYSYFGECTLDINNNKKYLYSLLSSQKLLFWDFGATQVFDYKHPYKVKLGRAAAYLLSSALRIFDIPFVPGFITNKLIGILKGFSVNGSLEESYLLNELTEMKRNNGVESESINEHIYWFFDQSVNPFLIRSEQLESDIIKHSKI